MRGAVVYVGAPVKRYKGIKRSMQRKVTIEMADWREDGGSYTSGEKILEAWVDVDDDAPDKGYVIEAKKVTVV